MKLQFKHQKFQADAAKAVVDVFAGQPYLTPTYMMDRGYGQQTLTEDTDFTGWRNERIVPELSDKLILEHLQKVQRTNQIKPSEKLEGRCNRRFARTCTAGTAADPSRSGSRTAGRGRCGHP